jgi:hypothetical protein
MSFLVMVGAIVAIDIAAKVYGVPTITQTLRNNRDEAMIGLVWLGVHVCKR